MCQFCEEMRYSKYVRYYRRLCLYGRIILVKAIPLCKVMAWLPFQNMFIYFTVFSVMHTTTGFHSLLTKWDGFWLTKDAFSFILGEGETRKFSFKDNNGCSPFLFWMQTDLLEWIYLFGLFLFSVEDMKVKLFLHPKRGYSVSINNNR